MRFAYPLLLFFILGLSCRKDSAVTQPRTEHVIVVFMDGARYSETFGDPAMRYIPVMRSLLGEASWFSSFYSDGPTQTTAGHTAVSTGVYQNINNGGGELPDEPGICQVWLKEMQKANSKAWVITSKDKLEVLRNCKNRNWKDLYMPRTNCGVNGLFTGYRNDTTTLRSALNVLSSYHPNLVLINFKEPDGAGHANNWDGYLQGIRDVDSYVGQLWQFIQSDPIYRDKTTLFVTNDHGRHLDNVNGGYTGHGDGCEGCRHIMLFAIGKSVPKGRCVTATYDMTDLHHTLTHFLGISDPEGNGDRISEFFKE